MLLLSMIYFFMHIGLLEYITQKNLVVTDGISSHVIKSLQHESLGHESKVMSKVLK